MHSVLQISKSTLLGFGLYQSYRNSRVLHAGWHEQKTLCSVDYISNIALFAILAQDNVSAVWGSSLASRLSKLSYASYIVIPTLHYLSDHLENSGLKESIDFSYLHINDLLLFATAVHSVAALRFGHQFFGNMIQLSFLLLTVLEQGVFGWEPRQNQGALAKAWDGEIYRRYQPLVSKLSYYLGIPIQFFFKGILGKALALATLFLRYAPSFYKAALVPSEIKKTFQERLEWERARGVALVPKGNLFSNEWVLQNRALENDFEEDLQWAVERAQEGWTEEMLREPFGRMLTQTLNTHFHLTERHLEAVVIEDFFPETTLSALEQELQSYVEKDTTLEAEERAAFEELLGVHGEAGTLRTVVTSSGNEALRIERECVFKSVFGALVRDWGRRKRHLLNRKGDFLCDPATSNSMKDLYFEFYPALKYSSEQETEESRLLGTRLQTRIALIFQQYRDHGFAAGIQEWSDKLKEFVSGPAQDEIAENKKRLYEEIRDLSQVTTKLWWSNLVQYIGKTIQGVLWENFTHFMEGLGTNRHGVNLNMAIYGKGLGLSGYDEARADMEKMLQQFSLNTDILDEISPHVGEFCKIQILRLHDQIWYPTLLESALQAGDERLRSDHLLTYMRYRVEDFANEKHRVQSEIVDHYTERSGDEEELKLLVAYYFPQILHDLNFLQSKPI